MPQVIPLAVNFAATAAWGSVVGTALTLATPIAQSPTKAKRHRKVKPSTKAPPGGKDQK